MKWKMSFIQSKVARQIFFLFILCALLPIAALALISFQNVTRQLEEQSRKQLREANKAQGMSIHERLELMETQMKMIASNLSSGPRAAPTTPPETVPAGLKDRFRALELVTDGGSRVTLFGRMQSAPAFTEAEKKHMGSGNTVVSSDFSPGDAPHIFMSRELNPEEPRRGILIGEVNTAYLWDADKLPALANLCVLDEANRVLFCSEATRPAFTAEVLGKINHATSGQFDWRQEDKRYVADYWSLYLKPVYLTQRWTVVLSGDRADMLAPLAHFKKTFLLVILLALWVVLLLSRIQIRRSLVPLEKLQEGTRRIANRDFECRVNVASGDEFQELAASFNSMASRLGRQFNSLKTISEIDRAILASWDTGKIVETVLIRLRGLLPYEDVSITLLDSAGALTARTYFGTTGPGTARQVELTTLTPEEVQELRRHREVLIVEGNETLRHYLAPLARRGMKSFLALPIFLSEQLSAILCLGHPFPPARTGEDVPQARQVADQVAVALSNARLLTELNQLHWGTLTALARAIDAKSPWTSGHSERVTNLAIKIARAMGLPKKELDIMQRGGLLHDIGKIGTPATILDKPGKLDAEEIRRMREHVRIGARILEPIPGFAECIPIVLQHHEWFDGSGYPDGLAGEAISLHARIFAVADCYDALISDRPYRPGLGTNRVLEMIKENAGKQFDPRVVDAFLGLVAREKSETGREVICAPAVGVS